MEMTDKEVNEKYILKFIESLEKDYPNWKMTVMSGMDGTISEYRSPDYANDGNTISFGAGSCNTGAWINGRYRWTLPGSVLFNPFNKHFWRYGKAFHNMKTYHKRKAHEEYLEELKSVL